MENATKALLIAAGVLVVIILIAFGMRVLNSSGDAASQAQATSQAITNQTTAASSSVSSALTSLNTTLNK